MPPPTMLTRGGTGRDSRTRIAIRCTSCRSSILPMQTTVFRRARMVKNSRLESVIEFFNGDGCGRGQIDVDGVAKFLGLEQVPPHPDVVLLRTVAHLPSFDVYSLRILLRANGYLDRRQFGPDAVASEDRIAERLYGDLHPAAGGRDFRPRHGGEQFHGYCGPVPRRKCRQAVRERLATMAGRLGIPIDSIPKFLEDYGDIFMSLSYYRQCLDQMLPQVQNFMEGIAMIRASHQLAQDRSI